MNYVPTQLASLTWTTRRDEQEQHVQGFTFWVRSWWDKTWVTHAVLESTRQRQWGDAIRPRVTAVPRARDESEMEQQDVSNWPQGMSTLCCYTDCCIEVELWLSCASVAVLLLYLAVQGLEVMLG